MYIVYCGPPYRTIPWPISLFISSLRCFWINSQTSGFSLWGKIVGSRRIINRASFPLKRSHMMHYLWCRLKPSTDVLQVKFTFMFMLLSDSSQISFSCPRSIISPQTGCLLTQPARMSINWNGRIYRYWWYLYKFFPNSRFLRNYWILSQPRPRSQALFNPIPTLS